MLFIKKVKHAFREDNDCIALSQLLKHVKKFDSIAGEVRRDRIREEYAALEVSYAYESKTIAAILFWV